MAQAARRLPPGPVVIIGSDIPGILPQDISLAFRRLGDHDAVFGPAADGGYWLVGLHRRPHFIDPFRAVTWSVSSTLSETLANLDGYRVAMVNELEDIDDAATLKRHAGWHLLNSGRSRQRQASRGVDASA